MSRLLIIFFTFLIYSAGVYAFDTEFGKSIPVASDNNENPHSQLKQSEQKRLEKQAADRLEKDEQLKVKESWKAAAEKKNKKDIRDSTIDDLKLRVSKLEKKVDKIIKNFKESNKQ